MGIPAAYAYETYAILGAKESSRRGGANGTILDHQFDHDTITVWYLLLTSDMLRYPIRRIRSVRILTMIFLVFTYIFAAEAFLKILALGFITYLQDPWNTFDFVIVIISISDVFISLTSSSDEAQNSGLNVLRTLRFKVKNKYMPLNMVMECTLRVYLKRKHFISLKSYIIRLRVVTNQVNFIESDCT